jgi:exopolysaccharide biosynthesis polyprenyl glycosylphosphotransferase
LVNRFALKRDSSRAIAEHAAASQSPFDPALSRRVALPRMRILRSIVGAGSLVLALLVVILLTGSLEGESAGPLSQRIQAVVVSALFVGMAFYLLGLLHRPGRIDDEVLAISAACAVGALPPLMLSVASGWLESSEALLGWFGTTILILIGRHAVRASAGADTTDKVKETLIVGSGPLAFSLHGQLSRDPGRRCLGFVDSRDFIAHPPIAQPLLGSLQQLDSILMRTVVDEVIVALPIKSKYAEIQAVIRSCEQAGVECTHSAHLFQHTLARPRLESRESFPAVRMLMVKDDRRLVVKRAFDLVGAVVVGLLCLPLIVAVSVAVKASSPGPIFFVQERYGHRKRRFRMYKFRTMVEEAEALQPRLERFNEATGHAFKIRQDPRLTPIGSFLRRWSLDELPQLLNVVKGDMSLVGPRPMSVRDVERFSDGCLMRRFSVRPGLTCLWQINGRSNLSFDDWMSLDLDYIDSWSTTLDLEILARTIPAVLRRSGAV